MRFVKKYPRARVSRHPSIKGWVIDIIQREGAKKKRVVATYASIPWAHHAARLKLGYKPTPLPTPPRRVTVAAPAAPQSARTAAAPAGTCKPCGSPMRPAGSKAADHPGTKLRQREGLCQSCNNAAKRTA